MKHFKFLNNLFGWLVFAIAALTYLLTMEPTASFWDCGEFISTAYKLDVGHPPGAPFFMLTGRFFSLFASDPTKVAMMVNTMSALCSAFTILFLFWSITHLARKLFPNNGHEMSVGQGIAILGAGLIGALAYTFSDTFWFSAVEGEVYAYSSFFTAVVFWAILKWDEQADMSSSDRWLILIAYLMGLSIGVHLLNLLAIPAIVLVYYFRKFQPTFKGFCIAMLTSVAILGTILYGMIPGFVEVACWFDLFFVNTLHLPFNSGTLVYIILAIGIVIWSIWEVSSARSYWRMAISFICTVTTVGIPFIGGSIWIGSLIIALLAGFFYWKRHKISTRWLHTTIMMITVMLIGYSSYALIVIRSAAEPPMDQNSPDNVFALKSYLNREQYGDRPLLIGQTYNSPVNMIPEGNYCVAEEKQGRAQYAPKPKQNAAEPDEYIITGYKTTPVMNKKFDMFFPRMYSSNANHIRAYESWAEVKGQKISYDHCGQRKTAVKPTFIENLRFFVRYQCNFMYWRYFMWNFSGRQNDLQGHGEIDKGNWITGIPLIDNWMLGDQSNLPDELAENKGRNRYYMLPLLLGIIGILFQLNQGKKGQQNFIITFMLFFLTGLAIVIYLNQTPYQPRERDYAYAGSFYAFCIWIGLGVLGVTRLIAKILPKPIASILATVFCLGIPTLMATENWDDHDRSKRYVARDFGGNYLTSCKENAVIFCCGDNDTFPLWYNQEVEGFRTDVRSCNLSYLNTDWYIDQMKRPYYQSAALPISWQATDYITGKNDYAIVENRLQQPLNLRDAYAFLLSDDPRTKINDRSYIPTDRVFIPVDTAKVLNNPVFERKDGSNRYTADQIVPQVDIKLKRFLTKSEMIAFDMIQTNNWERPIYFAVSVGSEYFLGLERYFELTGLTYQMTPVASKDGMPRVNTEELYDNLMNKFRYGGVNTPGVYLDETTLRLCNSLRSLFTQLTDALIREGKHEQAAEVIDRCLEVLPGSAVRHDYNSTILAANSYLLDKHEQGDEIMNAVATDCVQYINWGSGLDRAKRASVEAEMSRRWAILNHIMRTCSHFQRTDVIKQYESDCMRFYPMFETRR